MSDIFDLLKQDHDEFKEILDQLSMEEGEVGKVEPIFEKLRKKLPPHMKAEEATFYDSLLAKEEARQDALEALEEHHVADLVFAELVKLNKGDERWMPKLKVFKELLEHHIDEEEGPIFESAESALEESELKDIKTRFQSEKKKLMEKMK